MTVPAVVIDSTGIHAPAYEDDLAGLTAEYQGIYGSDAVLTPDSQDGELLGIFSQAIFDCQQGAVAAYFSFAPPTAQGAGLSQVVKINGIRRDIPTPSTVTITIVGVNGSVITNGQVGDALNLGTIWDLPTTVTIPPSGTIDVVATCDEVGATTAAPGSLTKILTPTSGWQSCTNAGSASVGAPAQSDALLRQKQAASTALPAQTVLEGISAAVGDVVGVSRVQAYQNDNGATDANGIPGHSIAIVVAGTGDATAIATAIALKKPPGSGTYGDQSVVIFDSKGVPNTISFFRVTNVEITVAITVQKLIGYVATTTSAIAQAVADFVAGLDIGEDSYLNRLFGPASLQGTAAAGTYVITSLTQSRSPAPPLGQNLVLAFNEAAACSLSDVTVTPV